MIKKGYDWKRKVKLFDIQVEKLQAVSVFFNFLTLYLITNQLNVSLIKQTLNWVCNSRALNSVFISCYELLGSFSSLFFWFTKQTHLPVRRIEIQSHHKTVRWNRRKIAERRWLQCVEIENRSTKLITVSIYLTSSSQLFQHTFHSIPFKHIIKINNGNIDADAVSHSFSRSAALFVCFLNCLFAIATSVFLCTMVHAPICTVTFHTIFY